MEKKKEEERGGHGISPPIRASSTRSVCPAQILKKASIPWTIVHAPAKRCREQTISPEEAPPANDHLESSHTPNPPLLPKKPYIGSSHLETNNALQVCRQWRAASIGRGLMHEIRGRRCSRSAQRRISLYYRWKRKRDREGQGYGNTSENLLLGKRDVVCNKPVMHIGAVEAKAPRR